MKQGFKLLERNYLRKWGEIDLVLQKDERIHFVEVKTVSCATYNAAENIHKSKIERLHRAIQTYLSEHKWEGLSWQLDATLVYLDVENGEARVEVLENIHP